MSWARIRNNKLGLDVDSLIVGVAWINPGGDIMVLDDLPEHEYRKAICKLIKFVLEADSLPPFLYEDSQGTTNVLLPHSTEVSALDRKMDGLKEMIGELKQPVAGRWDEIRGGLRHFLVHTAHPQRAENVASAIESILLEYSSIEQMWSIYRAIFYPLILEKEAETKKRVI